MKPFEKILDFIDRCRLKKPLIDRHKVYRSHIERFWTGARYKEEDKATHSFPHVKEEDLKDNDNDSVGLSERLCKGLWFWMGFTGLVNESHYNKENLSQSYKLLVHSMIYASDY
ncbi:hypothetical protein Hanom_Chr01g00040161 [Helianthus anomalus]